MANGVRVLLTEADGSILNDVTIPGGAGWTTNGSGTTAKWKGLTANGGIGKVRVKKSTPLVSGTPIKFAVTGKTGS